MHVTLVVIAHNQKRLVNCFQKDPHQSIEILIKLTTRNGPDIYKALIKNKKLLYLHKAVIDFFYL